MKLPAIQQAFFDTIVAPLGSRKASGIFHQCENESIHRTTAETWLKNLADDGYISITPEVDEERFHIDDMVIVIEPEDRKPMKEYTYCDYTFAE